MRYVCVSLKELTSLRVVQFPARNLFGTSPIVIRIASCSSNSELGAIFLIMKHVFNPATTVAVDNVNDQY